MKDMIHRNSNYHHENFFSVVVIKLYRNQGQSPWKREEGTWSQHFEKMTLNITKPYSTVTVKNVTKSSRDHKISFPTYPHCKVERNVNHFHNENFLSLIKKICERI